MGSNVHGFSNEQRIHEALHNAKCNELNPNLLKLFLKILKIMIHWFVKELVVYTNLIYLYQMD